LRQCNKKVRKILHSVHAFGKFTNEESCKADRALCEVDAFIKTFKTVRAFGSTHCFWVLPVNFPMIRRKLKCRPLNQVKASHELALDVRVVGRVRFINQRDYRELGSEEMMARVKPGEETRFINITIEDEEDYIGTTIPRKYYQRLKNTVFKYLKIGSVMYGKGTILVDGNRVFLSEIAAVEVT
jgi:hypothetical protein